MVRENRLYAEFIPETHEPSLRLGGIAAKRETGVEGSTPGETSTYEQLDRRRIHFPFTGPLRSPKFGSFCLQDSISSAETRGNGLTAISGASRRA